MVVISSLPRGGAERVVSTLTLEWCKYHEVTIALFDGARPAYRYGGRIVDLRLPAMRTRLKKAYRVWERSLGLARLFQRERPDRIVSFMESANFPTIVAALATGFLDRLLVSVRNNPSEIAILYRVLIPWVYRAPAKVVALSKGVKGALEGIRVPAEKVWAIPNPLVPEVVAIYAAQSPFIARFILGAGRLHAQKGFDRLLSAFSNVNQSDLHLVILGEGDERTRLVAQTHDLGIESRVHFPGVVTDIWAWYQYAQCFVLSSRYEGFSNVLMEAMASGCPAVSFDCQYGPAEVIEHGKSGLLVPQDDVNALTEVIVQVLSDRTLRMRLSAEGRKRASAFAVEEIAPLWLADTGV